MKRIVMSVVVGLMSTIGLVAVGTAPASAAASWVTPAEYRTVSKGDTMARVQNVFDHNGWKYASGSGWQWRTYDVKDPYGWVHVKYVLRAGKWKLERKKAKWGIVTKPEFRAVRKGMSLAKVHRIFDVQGRQTNFWGATSWSPAEQWREYPVKSTWGWVDLDFEKRKGVWRLTEKSAYWG